MNTFINKNDLEIIKQWLGSGAINIFGRPFSGKDTQGHRLAELLGAPLIGGGDILRSSDNEHVKSIIDTGKLAPQTDFLNMILPYLSKAEFNDRPLVLSSIGRWKGEEEPILTATQTASHPIKAIVTLTIPEATVHERWEKARHDSQRGDRRDDDKQHIETRLDEYRNKTIPVIQLFRAKGMLIEVDGTLTPDRVTANILSSLLSLATAT